MPDPFRRKWGRRRADRRVALYVPHEDCDTVECWIAGQVY